MTTSAQSIVLRASVALQDEDGVRWPADELVRHLNDGQRELARLRPDTKATTATVALSPGFRHTLPVAAMTLIDITHNTGGTKRGVTKTDMPMLDAVHRAWRSETASAEVTHFCYDLREPRTFFTYPPVNASASVEMVYTAYPVDLPIPASTTYIGVTGDIDYDDKWAEALYNFVMFKAYSKDVEFGGGNVQLAAQYFQLFNTAIGTQLQATATVAPQN